VRLAPLLVASWLAGSVHSMAQGTPTCRLLCAPEFKIEPTLTFTNLFGSPRIADNQGSVRRQSTEREFELILSLALPTRTPWLEFTVEAIFLPFKRESTPELEFETNLIWLSPERTRGWLSSHSTSWTSSARPNARRIAAPTRTS
jgi:hypothetical protein